MGGSENAAERYKRTHTHTHRRHDHLIGDLGRGRECSETYDHLIECITTSFVQAFCEKISSLTKWFFHCCIVGIAASAFCYRTAMLERRRKQDDTSGNGSSETPGASFALRGGSAAGAITSSEGSSPGAIEMLKAELSNRFTTVYEAFTFLDMNGDGGVTVGEMRAMLKQLGVQDLESAARAFDKDGKDAEIDINRFVAALSWHPTGKDHQAEIDALRPRRERIVMKAIKLGGAITAVRLSSTSGHHSQGDACRWNDSHTVASNLEQVAGGAQPSTSGHEFGGVKGKRDQVEIMLPSPPSPGKWKSKWQKSILAVTSFSSLIHDAGSKPQMEVEDINQDLDKERDKHKVASAATAAPTVADAMPQCIAGPRLGMT